MMRNKKRWFGPAKVVRLGIRPTSWQGMVIYLLLIALLAADFIAIHNMAAATGIAILLIGIFTAIVYRTGGKTNTSVLS